MNYTLDKNAVFEFYLDEGNYPEKPQRNKIILALEQFSVENMSRVNESQIVINGKLLGLVKVGDAFQEFENNLKIPFLYNEVDTFGNKKPWDKDYFDDLLNPMSTDTEVISENFVIVTGDKADAVRKEFKEGLEHSDLPKLLQRDIDSLLKSYQNNNSFRERYDKIATRFTFMAEDLSKKYPNDVIFKRYKGVPVLYTLGTSEYNSGKFRIYMTPIDAGIYGKEHQAPLTKLYDLRYNNHTDAVAKMQRLDPKYLVCSQRYKDFCYILNNMNLRRKLPQSYQWNLR